MPSETGTRSLICKECIVLKHREMQYLIVRDTHCGPEDCRDVSSNQPATENYSLLLSSKWVPFLNQEKLMATKGEGWALFP